MIKGEQNDDRALWVMDGGGSNLRRIAALPSAPVQVEVSADGSAVIVVFYNEVIKYPSSGNGSPQVLFDRERGYLINSALFAPDRSTVLLKSEGDNANFWFMIDTVVGQVFSVPDEARVIEEFSTRAYPWHTVWAPGSKLLAMTGYDQHKMIEPEGHPVWVFDTQFKLVKTFNYRPA
ncbi:hypothetical protein LP420_39765 [Massilia sp. B-10]|nr:hypothetical protein LP420_39765 [Massilia sp. B-10]